MMEAFSKSAFQKLRQRDGNQEGKSYLRLVSLQTVVMALSELFASLPC
jgi:hypothetical protein